MPIIFFQWGSNPIELFLSPTHNSNTVVPKKKIGEGRVQLHFFYVPCTEVCSTIARNDFCFSAGRVAIEIFPRLMHHRSTVARNENVYFFHWGSSQKSHAVVL